MFPRRHCQSQTEYLTGAQTYHLSHNYRYSVNSSASHISQWHSFAHFIRNHRQSTAYLSRRTRALWPECRVGGAARGPPAGQRGTIPASRLKNNPLRMRRWTARSAARRSVDAVTRFERVLAKSIYLRCAAHVPFYVPLADNFGSVNRALRRERQMARRSSSGAAATLMTRHLEVVGRASRSMP